MPRTTLNIDAPILDAVKEVQAREKRSLGAVVSELLASALHQRASQKEPPEKLRWYSQDMGTPYVDLEDKEALNAVLDGRSPAGDR